MIVDQGCTLCDICVQVCRPGALQRVRHAKRGTVTLHLDGNRCDGCAACQRWCPEEVIEVKRLVDSERLTDGELARSAMLACPRCGQPHAPEAMVAKVQARVGHGHEALLQRLALCHDCKVTDVPLRRGNTMQRYHAELPAGAQAKGLSGDAPPSHRRSR